MGIPEKSYKTKIVKTLYDTNARNNTIWMKAPSWKSLMNESIQQGHLKQQSPYVLGGSSTLTFAQHCLSPLSVFTSGVEFLHAFDNKFVKFTMPALKPFF